MMRTVFQLSPTAQSLCSSIGATLMTQFSTSKSKQAQKKRKKEDKDGTSEIIGQRLATQDEVTDALTLLQSALKSIAHFSNEFGMALLHHNRRLGNNASDRGLADSVPELLPRDPFAVNETVMTRTLDVLKTVIAEIKNLGVGIERT